MQVTLACGFKQTRVYIFCVSHYTLCGNQLKHSNIPLSISCANINFSAHMRHDLTQEVQLLPSLYVRKYQLVLTIILKHIVYYLQTQIMLIYLFYISESIVITNIVIVAGDNN